MTDSGSQKKNKHKQCFHFIKCSDHSFVLVWMYAPHIDPLNGSSTGKYQKKTQKENNGNKNIRLSKLCFFSIIFFFFHRTHSQIDSNYLWLHVKQQQISRLLLWFRLVHYTTACRCFWRWFFYFLLC